MAASGVPARPGVKGQLMKTQKRFTPSLLERFEREGRSTGTYQSYIPWHRVGRGDPSSRGRSHLLMWKDRQRELLSDGERVCLLFGTLLNTVKDVREQLKISLEDGPHELEHYDARYKGQNFPGTLSIASQLGIKHPRVNGEGRSSDWVMTTDQVVLLQDMDGHVELLAISCKPDGAALTKRARQLLSIEAAYWAARSVQWILITPDLFEESVGITLRRTAPWGLGAPVSRAAIRAAVIITEELLGHSFKFTLDALADQLGDVDLAQRAFWQAVWCGSLPVDLRRGWRPHLPIELLDTAGFIALNPVASRRSSWN